uniref:Tify domain-containing protein n=1 Tax=Ananas comosus var. bracteatus TaxID=296719 RepID=A0A6V7QG15_ANACO|nr:unnamed protein product [Ananas comosus var. bracteatus]
MSEADPQERNVYGHDAVAGAEDLDGAISVAAVAPEQEHFADAADSAMPLMSAGSNQLTLLFQGEVYVFDSVTPEKVQAVLLLLGGCEVPTGIASMALPAQQDERYSLNIRLQLTVYDDILRRTDIPAKRIASLIRFREKRKERNFDKKIRYTVRKEVALRIEEMKCLIRIIPVWAAGIICFVALAQQWTFAVLQALTMDRHLGPHFQIPAGSFATIALLTLTLFIPIYDQLFVPSLDASPRDNIAPTARSGPGDLRLLHGGGRTGRREAEALRHRPRRRFAPLRPVACAAARSLGRRRGVQRGGSDRVLQPAVPRANAVHRRVALLLQRGGASYLSSIIVAVIHKSTGGDGPELAERRHKHREVGLLLLRVSRYGRREFRVFRGVRAFLQIQGHAGDGEGGGRRRGGEVK